MNITQRKKIIKGQLRAYRAMADLKQKDLANAIGVNPSTMSHWESGDGQIDLEKAWRIADFYGISLDQLAGRIAPAGTGADEGK